MRDEQRVFVLEVFQILQNWLALVRETVVPPPFQIAELRGKGDKFLFKVEKQLKRDVKKVAAATGGIEHTDGGEFVVKRGEFRTIGRFALTTHERGREFAFDV